MAGLRSGKAGRASDLDHNPADMRASDSEAGASARRCETVTGTRPRKIVIIKQVNLK